MHVHTCVYTCTHIHTHAISLVLFIQECPRARTHPAVMGVMEMEASPPLAGCLILTTLRAGGMRPLKMKMLSLKENEELAGGHQALASRPGESGSKAHAFPMEPKPLPNSPTRDTAQLERGLRRRSRVRPKHLPCSLQVKIKVCDYRTVSFPSKGTQATWKNQ